jgi:Holliday junction resolvase RusA-like endonuclease
VSDLFNSGADIEFVDIYAKPPERSQHEVFRFTVPGEPVAKGRPRLGIIKGHAMAFTPKETRVYESEIKHAANVAWGYRHPLDGVAVVLAVDVYRSIPKSLSKRKTELARSGAIRPISKPDADNYAKSVCDGMNGVVFRDDAAVVSLTVRKWYDDKPRLEVVMTWSDAGK